MNFFEFFEIPAAFYLDEGDLKRRFLLNSKKYHPDHFTLESEEKQAEVLELSAMNNQAYKTLSDFDKRMAYLLELKGILNGESKNEVPQDFLLEMMEINEALMELEFDFDEKVLAEAKSKAEQLEAELLAPIEPVLRDFDEYKTTADDLKKVKDFYLKKRYVLRILENLNRFAPASKEAPQD